MTDRLTFEAAIKQVSPPWLRRTEGGRLMGVFGRMIDNLVDRSREAVLIRFPGQDGDALPAIGRDRRIRRGPAEADDVYAGRLQRWWDDHQSRGGPFALLRQLHAFWNDALEAQIDIVYYNGTRRYIEPGGTITRDSIAWSADASGNWCQVWIVFNLGADAAGLVSGGSVSAATEAALKAVPADWCAAHIWKCHIVLFTEDLTELWDYPAPVGTWDEGSETWNKSGDPVVITITFGT